MACRRLLALALALPYACTEPNPNAGDDGTSDAASTSVTTGATTSSADGMTTTSATAGPSTSAGDDGTTGSFACPIGTHLCVPVPPPGWSGPAGVIDDTPLDGEAGCADPYGVAQTIGFDALDAPEAVCGCTCDGPSGSVGCTQLELVRDNTAGCGSPTDSWMLSTQACFASPEGIANQYWQATTGGLNSGVCRSVETEEIPPAVFGGRHTLCGASEIETSLCPGDDVCSPIPIAPFAGELCIWKGGDRECPPDIGYDVRRLLFEDVLYDTRECSACICALEGECTGVVYLFGDDGCEGQFAAGTLVFDGACVQVASNVTEVDISGYDVEASCNPSDSQPLGTVVGTEPLTVCCRE
jgi:hypothetical protein